MIKRSDFLNLLAKSKGKTRRDKLIDLADKNEINAIVECIVNALAGNIPLKKQHITNMKKHRKQLRMISQKQYPMKQKKKLMKQTGGLLPALLPLALSAIGNLVGSFLK